MAIFERIPEMFALCQTTGRGKWETQVFKCAADDTEEYYIKKGSYYLKIHRKLGSCDYWHTSDGKTVVQAVFAPTPFVHKSVRNN